MIHFTRRSALKTSAASLVAYGLARVAPARAADKVRVSALPHDAALEPLFAVDSGIPSKFGIDLDVQMLANGGAVMSAVIGGALDVGTSNTLTVLQAREKGIPVVVIAPGVVYSTRQPTSVLMVAKDAPYKSAQELNGKIVAVDGLRNITEFAVRGWMDGHGGDASSLKFIEMPFASMPAALQSGRVDAALVAEPSVTLGRDRARVFAKAYDSIAPQFQLAVYFATESWANANQDLVRRVQQTVQSVGAWANANQATTAGWLEKASNIEPAVVSTMKRARWGEKIDYALVTPVIAAAVKYGAISKTVAARDIFATAVR
jgi:NitT/TauT family transport system substrate-binding protein